jgi:hypothetical protein
VRKGAVRWLPDSALKSGIVDEAMALVSSKLPTRTINPHLGNASGLASLLQALGELQPQIDVRFLLSGHLEEVLWYLAKNPNGNCGIGGCGVPFRSAELAVGEQA